MQMKEDAKSKPDRNYRERVYKVVRRIPRGRVMTYGQIAYQLGEGYTPRTVGFVMHAADDQTLAKISQLLGRRLDFVMGSPSLRKTEPAALQKLSDDLTTILPPSVVASAP